MNVLTWKRNLKARWGLGFLFVFAVSVHAADDITVPAEDHATAPAVPVVPPTTGDTPVTTPAPAKAADLATLNARIAASLAGQIACPDGKSADGLQAKVDALLNDWKNGLLDLRSDLQTKGAGEALIKEIQTQLGKLVHGQPSDTLNKTLEYIYANIRTINTSVDGALAPSLAMSAVPPAARTDLTRFFAAYSKDPGPAKAVHSNWNEVRSRFAAAFPTGQLDGADCTKKPDAAPGTDVANRGDGKPKASDAATKIAGTPAAPAAVPSAKAAPTTAPAAPSAPASPASNVGSSLGGAGDSSSSDSAAAFVAVSRSNSGDSEEGPNASGDSSEEAPVAEDLGPARDYNGPSRTPASNQEDSPDAFRVVSADADGVPVTNEGYQNLQLSVIDKSRQLDDLESDIAGLRKGDSTQDSKYQISDGDPGMLPQQRREEKAQALEEKRARLQSEVAANARSLSAYDQRLAAQKPGATLVDPRTQGDLIPPGLTAEKVDQQMAETEKKRVEIEASLRGGTLPTPVDSALKKFMSGQIGLDDLRTILDRNPGVSTANLEKIRNLVKIHYQQQVLAANRPRSSKQARR